MKITLYRYIGDSDTANKLLKQCTVIYDKEVVPYGAFNPNGAAFRLDTLHDVNYGKFTYNSHDYYGYVDVSTDSKGIYTYTITTDPLTTAWYAGCFNVGNICKYSDYGTGKFFDDRATYSPDLNYEYIQVKEASTNFRVIMVVARSYQVSETYGDIYNPMYDVYSMSFEDFYRFCYYSYTKEYEDTKSSIFRIYAVPVDEITSLSSKYLKVEQINLYAAVGAEGYVKVCPPNVAPTKLTNTFKIDIPASGYTFNENWLSTFRATINKPINSWRRQNMIKLYVEDMGYIAFKYSDVAKGANITSIGYRKSFDFISGLQRATLIVNNEVLKDYFIQSSIANTLPYFDAEHQKSWNERFAGVLSAGIGLASGVIGIGSSISAGLAAQSVFKDKLAANAEVRAFYNKGSQYQNYLGKNYGIKSENWFDRKENEIALERNSAISNNALSGLMGGRNIVSSFNQMNNVSQGSGFAINGSGAGSLDLPNRQGSFIIWQEAPPHNLADIEGKFGKPDGLVRVVGNMTGWVQTEACHLPSNGLPFDIVDAAEKAADIGFRIVS